MGHPIKHFITITKHRHLVMKYCFKVGIGFQGLKHDLSKYSFVEFYNGAKYYSGVHSPIGDEKKVRGYSKAWLHHKGRNKHHFEYWTYYSSLTKQFEKIKVPINYVKEMICDKVAASKNYHKHEYNDQFPLDFFNSKNEESGMHPDTAKLLKDWLTLISVKGEKEAFKEIKKIKQY